MAMGTQVRSDISVASGEPPEQASIDMREQLVLVQEAMKA
jgi:hypothetical protein